MAIRDIITKKVVSIYEGEVVGYVLGLKIRNKMEKIESIIIADDENDMEYILKTQDIFDMNNDCVMIKNKSKLMVTTDTKSTNINMEILGINGINYGKVEDIKYNKNYKIEKILCKNIEFLPKNIINMGENIIIINDTNKKYNRGNFAITNRIKIDDKNTQVVEILPHSTLPTPIKVNSTATLLGRRLNKDLMTNNGEIIARKNSIVTIPMINSAKQFNIMAELIQSVK